METRKLARGVRPCCDQGHEPFSFVASRESGVADGAWRVLLDLIAYCFRYDRAREVSFCFCGHEG